MQSFSNANSMMNIEPNKRSKIPSPLTGQNYEEISTVTFNAHDCNLLLSW